VPSERRLLLVHAHPDDETIETGATIAACAASGVEVTLVTCTLGELGEIIPPELAHLAADREDRLGAHRTGELARACAALGVTTHQFLGGPGRWRDSGMMGEPGNDDPRCFWQAAVDEAAAELATVISEARPQVVVTYDERGYYGHPDHIQAHRVTVRALALAAPRHQVAKLYATAMPRTVLAAAIDLPDPAPGGFRRAPSVAALPFGVPDEQVTTEIDATAQLAAKSAAMRAHATQIAVAGEYFALSDLVGRRILGREYYTLLTGPRGPGSGGHGWEADLFAGV
jgi:N-acetyl-1-D-myo-inositol-2-amino-2-deoxy-alpha-D-glucopyranoside deacetylase